MNVRIIWLCLLSVAAAVAAMPGTSSAHTRSLSYSSWKLSETGARVRVRIPRLELTRVGLDALPGDGAQWQAAADYVAARLEIRSAREPCRRSGAIESRRAREGWAAFAWSVACPSGRPDTIRSAILLDAAPSHLHFARVASDSGRINERVLTEEAPEFDLLEAGLLGADASGADSSQGSRGTIAATLWRYTRIGVAHILSGWDHLAFVLALLLLASRLRQVTALVTGFTIAHSATLALAVLGMVRPQPAAVESVIAFSVVLVAGESLWERAERPRIVPVAGTAAASLVALLAMAGVGVLGPLAAMGLALFTACHFALIARSRAAAIRAALAFAFGLVHGFGFAGVLAEMQLPASRLAPALFGFNLGVEIGQLAVVALAWPALRALARRGDGVTGRWATDLICAGICGVGIFWFVTRNFGPGL